MKRKNQLDEIIDRRRLRLRLRQREDEWFCVLASIAEAVLKTPLPPGRKGKLIPHFFKDLEKARRIATLEKRGPRGKLWVPNRYPI